MIIEIILYDLYNEFNKSNKCDLFQLNQKIELVYNFAPVVINYRKFFNNILFCIKYNIYQYCPERANMEVKEKKYFYLILLLIFLWIHIIVKM